MSTVSLRVSAHRSLPAFRTWYDMGSCMSKAITLVPVEDPSDYDSKPCNTDSTHLTSINYDGVSFMNEQLNMNQVIGRGGYGLVVAVQDSATKKFYALKIQMNGRTAQNEEKVYEKLKKVDGVPKFYAAFSEKSHYFFQLELVGMNMQDYVHQMGRPMIMAEAFNLAPKMIDVIEAIHAKGVIHSDIKPGNIAFGVGSKAAKVYILDFGLAVNYLDENGKHIDERFRRHEGTYVFMSSNTHSNLHNSRRDDLESLVYTLMHLMYIPMPWESKPAPHTDGDHALFSSMKDAAVVNNTLINFPELQQMLKMVRDLPYKAAPNYKALKALFKKTPKVVVKPPHDNIIIKRMLRDCDKELLERFHKDTTASLATRLFARGRPIVDSSDSSDY